MGTSTGRRPQVLDVILGLLLSLVGIALFLGNTLGVPISRPGVGAFGLLVGVLVLCMGLLSKVSALFWTEVGLGSPLVVLGGLLLLRTADDLAFINVVMGALLAVSVVTRLASLTEFADVRLILLCSAAALTSLSAAVLMQSGTPGIGWIAMVLGGMCTIDGVTIVALGRR